MTFRGRITQLQMTIIVISALIVALASITTVEAQHAKRVRAGLPPISSEQAVLAAIE